MSSAEPLAKSGEAPVRLAMHLQQVTDYARAAAEAFYPHWCRVMSEEWAQRVKQALVVAALAHDLGKAAEGFQHTLHNRKSHWEFRHEVLSTALLLAAAKPDDELMELIIAAVLTHHRDLNDPQLCNDSGWVALPMPEIEQETISKFQTKAGELRAHWKWLQKFCQQQAELKFLCLPDAPGGLPLPADFLGRLKQTVQNLSLFQNHKATALLLTRGWLMAADHAVSSGITEFKSALPILLPIPWLRQSLRPFQRRLSEHDGDAFLGAATGSGKTIAALCWALNNRQHGERIFYLLPYQASIEAMADILEQKMGKDNVAVLHARALDYAFREHFERAGEYEVAHTQAKAEAEVNRLVHKPIKVATPFQLLKWLFGVPRFEIGVSEMVGGLFIFDEIHAYDSHVVALIAEMVRVIKQLGGRCLFMSATFPPFLKSLLQDVLGAPTTEFTLNADEEDEWTRRFLLQVRHRLRWHEATLEELLPNIIEAVEGGKRVLVVANRVAQAQEIYRELCKHLSAVHLLHSRFTRHDRVMKEQEVIGALQGKREVEVRVLVSTQVVEVSLDVSFDTIFTEVAPVDDLLQRFGRVNRYGEHPNGVEVHVAQQFDAERLRWVYDLDRVQSTLDNAPDDGEPLTVDMATEWVRQVYREGWTDKERHRFDQACKAFRSVLRLLRPLHHDHEGKEEFYGLFQSAEILPRELYREYDEHIRNKHYLLATQLLVPIPLGAFHALKKAGRITPLKDGVCLADVRYAPELGLLSEEADRNVGII
jgi:CRISPR-associated endonuclease/helicase Cas3